MPVERRGQVTDVPTGNPILDGRLQPSCGGTSRITRECQVRICERLGVKFPGPTRPKQPNRHVRSMVAGCRTWRGWLNSVLNDPHKTSCEFAYAAFTGSPFSNEAGNSLFLLADLRNKSARPAAATGRLKK